MSEQDMQIKMDKAVFDTIASLIALYFSIVKPVLFLIGIVFAVVIIGVMLSSKILMSAIKLAGALSSKPKKIGATL